MPLRKNAVDWWPLDYFASRKRFIELATAGGARINSHPVESVGRGGEPLYVDVAAFGPESADHLIIITSGVHGVEGFLGACVQVRAMQKLSKEGIPDRTSVVMIHAVNPWGFAHLRRVNENNVDVNRNFIDSSQARTASVAGYASLDALINPPLAPNGVSELKFWHQAVQLIFHQRGIGALAKAIAEGQDQFPKGLFFCGTQVSESCQLLQNLILEHSMNVGRITHLDIHSGLGSSAAATLIGNSNVGPREGRAERLQAHYRQTVTLDDSPGNAYNAQGTLSRWYQRSLSDTPFVYLCVEIGTVNPFRVLSALKRENQAHHWTEIDSPSYRKSKRALQAVFSPRSRNWRERSVAEGLHAFDRAMALPMNTSEGDI